MDDFFAAEGDDGLNPGTFVPATMGAFITLLPSAGFACVGNCFVLWHIYQRCVKNDRRQSASRWQQLAILLALLCTGAFWAVTEVFQSQLSDRLAPSMVFGNGSVSILALSSLILLSTSLLASVLPVLLARIRSQYYYHGKNLAVANPSISATRKAAVDSRKEENSGEAEEEKTTEDKAKRRPTSIGKRTTKIFSSDSKGEGSKKSDDLEHAGEELKGTRS
ncbi:hypothetical protein NCC49_000723 [Naganishia albida]|nr:hypothetical protein NCC49_000723 [Naganishia albida]